MKKEKRLPLTYAWPWANGMNAASHPTTRKHLNILVGKQQDADGAKEIEKAIKFLMTVLATSYLSCSMKNAYSLAIECGRQIKIYALDSDKYPNESFIVKRCSGTRCFCESSRIMKTQFISPQFPFYSLSVEVTSPAPSRDH